MPPGVLSKPEEVPAAGLQMMDLSRVTPGLVGTAELWIGEEHTAPRVGSGRVHVLATPVMINLMEAAALAAVEHLLPAGHQSLGIALDVGHYAATPTGMRLRARAELVTIEARTLSFQLEAYDEVERVGHGTHRRVVVNVDRFDARVRKKVDDLKPGGAR